MNKLYFVKMESQKDWSIVVFLFTSENEETAAAHGLAMIDPLYVAEFITKEVTLICETPNTVLCFEPC